jgi:hypothetical protein
VAVLTNATGIATAPPYTANDTMGSYTIKAILGSLSVNIAATNYVSSITTRT